MIDLAELYNLYHTARVALAGRKDIDDTPYQRKMIAARWYNEKHPEISQKAAYLAFERN